MEFYNHGDQSFETNFKMLLIHATYKVFTNGFFFLRLLGSQAIVSDQNGRF